MLQLPGEFSPFIEKKCFFCLVVGGVTPTYTLSGRTDKKNFFSCVSSLIPYPFLSEAFFPDFVVLSGSSEGFKDF